MSKISLASRLAISFIRPFRYYLDGSMIIKESKQKYEEDMRNVIDKMAENAQKINPHIDAKNVNYTKESALAINMQMFSNYNKSYEKILPDVIEGLTISLEKEIANSFSDQEMERIIDILTDPVISKLVNNKKIFGLLKAYEIEMDSRLKIKTLQDLASKESLEQLQNVFNDLKIKWGIPDKNENTNNFDDNGKEWLEDEENDDIA